MSEYALDISTLWLCTEYTLEAVYTSVHDVAAFTTCHARLKLYESLDAIQVSKSFTMIPIVWCTNGAPINPSSPLATFLGTRRMNSMMTSSQNSSQLVPKTMVTWQGREKWSAMSAHSPWMFAVRLSSIFTPWKTSWQNWTIHRTIVTRWTWLCLIISKGIWNKSGWKSFHL